jgi:two-component system OmpR family response regulator
LEERRRLVLIIDDDASGAQLVATLLEFEGFDTLQPANWDDPVLDVELQKPNVVLIDVRLRGRSGFDLLKRIRGHPDPEIAGLPVIMMSAEDHHVESRRSGADGFLSKPFNVPAMLEIVHQVGGG